MQHSPRGCAKVRIMKIRIGYGLGAVPSLYPRERKDPGGLGRVVDDLDKLGFDSLWFPERINSAQLDPIVARSEECGIHVALRPQHGAAISTVAKFERLQQRVRRLHH